MNDRDNSSYHAEIQQTLGNLRLVRSKNVLENVSTIHQCIILGDGTETNARVALYGGLEGLERDLWSELRGRRPLRDPHRRRLRSA